MRTGRRGCGWSGAARLTPWRPRWPCATPRRPSTGGRRPTRHARVRCSRRPSPTAGASGLAAAARKAAEELGGLESARRAEHRLAELATEREALDRQERADEDVFQDAESWLASWETTRAGLQARIESAQEAATRAEQLAVQREPARVRLEAARLRDQLMRRHGRRPGARARRARARR